MNQVMAAAGYPEELPRRRRKTPSTLPDWSDLSQVRAWVFRPVPVVRSQTSGFARDLATVERVYQWMRDQGWGRRDA